MKISSQTARSRRKILVIIIVLGITSLVCLLLMATGLFGFNLATKLPDSKLLFILLTLVGFIVLVLYIPFIVLYPFTKITLFLGLIPPEARRVALPAISLLLLISFWFATFAYWYILSHIFSLAIAKIKRRKLQKKK